MGAWIKDRQRHQEKQVELGVNTVNHFLLNAVTNPKTKPEGASVHRGCMLTEVTSGSTEWRPGPYGSS